MRSNVCKRGFEDRIGFLHILSLDPAGVNKSFRVSRCMAKNVLNTEHPKREKKRAKIIN